MKITDPAVIKVGLLYTQVCVPAEWDDETVTQFAERENPCGTQHGWSIRREGDKALAGCPERRTCAERSDYVHIMLDA